MAGPTASKSEPFVRTFEIPPAAPWEQHQAADLEAMHGSPLPPGDAAVCIQRLEPWRPGRPGRFCAAYLRRSDVTGEHVVRAIAGGQPVVFVFRSPKHAVARRSQRVRDILLGLFAGVAIISAALKSGTLHKANVAAAADAESSGRRALAIRAATERQAQAMRVLEGLHAEGRTGAELMTDLAWVGRHRLADVRIEAIDWNGGEMTVHATGQEPPLSPADRSVQRKGGAGAADSVWRVAPPDSTGARPPSIVQPAVPIVRR
jgi:hypothetical protein